MMICLSKIPEPIIRMQAQVLRSRLASPPSTLRPPQLSFPLLASLVVSGDQTVQVHSEGSADVDSCFVLCLTGTLHCVLLLEYC